MSHLNKKNNAKKIPRFYPNYSGHSGIYNLKLHSDSNPKTYSLLSTIYNKNIYSDIYDPNNPKHPERPKCMVIKPLFSKYLDKYYNYQDNNHGCYNYKCNSHHNDVNNLEDCTNCICHNYQGHFTSVKNIKCKNIKTYLDYSFKNIK